jgi:hypothetical protein
MIRAIRGPPGLRGSLRGMGSSWVVLDSQGSAHGYDIRYDVRGGQSAFISCDVRV